MREHIAGGVSSHSVGATLLGAQLVEARADGEQLDCISGGRVSADAKLDVLAQPGHDDVHVVLVWVLDGEGGDEGHGSGGVHVAGRTWMVSYTTRV